MGSRLGLCANIFRVIFCIVNLLILLLGLAAIGVAIYLFVVNDTLSFLTGSTIISGAAIILIAGVVTVVIAGVGFVGAGFKWRPLLLIYVIILVVIVILEVIAGILGFVFRGQFVSAAQGQIATTMDDFVRQYRRAQDDPDYSAVVNTAVDTVQRSFRCCGSNSSLSWNTLNPQFLLDNQNRLPQSCDCTEVSATCANVTFQITNSAQFVNQLAYSQSCIISTSAHLTTATIVAGGIGIVFGLLEILGILVGLGLCCCITMADKDKEVV